MIELTVGPEVPLPTPLGSIFAVMARATPGQVATIPYSSLEAALDDLHDRIKVGLGRTAILSQSRESVGMVSSVVATWNPAKEPRLVVHPDISDETLLGAGLLMLARATPERGGLQVAPRPAADHLLPTTADYAVDEGGTWDYIVVWTRGSPEYTHTRTTRVSTLVEAAQLVRNLVADVPPPPTLPLRAVQVVLTCDEGWSNRDDPAERRCYPLIEAHLRDGAGELRSEPIVWVREDVRLAEVLAHLGVGRDRLAAAPPGVSWGTPDTPATTPEPDPETGPALLVQYQVGGSQVVTVRMLLPGQREPRSAREVRVLENRVRQERRQRSLSDMDILVLGWQVLEGE